MVRAYRQSVGISQESIMNDDIRQQRMARYKEERRRQLAAQFGRRDVAMSDMSDSAYGIRSTRASRLRSAATSANSESTAASGNARFIRKETNSTLRTLTTIVPPSSSVTTSSDTAKEKSPPLVPCNIPITTSSTPRRERDKSSKRKSNLNRQINPEEVIHVDTPPSDDGVRRRRSRMVSPSINISSSCKTVSPRSSVTHITCITTSPRQVTPSASTESSKRLTPPRKINERSNSASIPITDNDNISNSRVTTTKMVANSASAPSAPISRIPKKVASSPSLLSSSSRESSPRHKSGSHRLSLISTSHITSSPLTSNNVSPSVITISNGPTTTAASSATPGGPSPVVIHSVHHVNGQMSFYNSSNSNSDTIEIIELNNDVTNRHSSVTLNSSDNALDQVTGSDLALHDQFQPPNSPRHVRPVITFKKKSSLSEDINSGTVSQHAMPVSILKRKSSQEEGCNSSGGMLGSANIPPPPVTFSPSVVDPVPGRRQGILKKHRSLDEAEVTRRRSCSPDVETAEFRPILKHQRRSSLEELHRRTQSPEPQSILKRKTSREEGVEANTTSEPQGILKRKTSTTSSEEGLGHVTIADTVILAITGGVPAVSEDHVKPILKKKSISGEEIPSEITSSSETPRPILKKKSSVETEDIEDKHHVKPILKSRKDNGVSSAFVRIPSLKQESKPELSSGEDCITVLLNNSDHESETNSSICSGVVPILKKSESEPVSNVDTNASSYRFIKTVIWRNNSVSDNDQNAHKRRSLDIVTTRDETSLLWPTRPLSVAERIMNMESFLASEGCSDCSITNTTGAIPKRLRDKDRFRTQPITALEINKTKSWIPENPIQPLNIEIDSLSHSRNQQPDQSQQQQSPPIITVKSVSPVTDNEISDPPSYTNLTRSDSVSAKASLFNHLEAQMKLAAEEDRLRRLNKGSGRRLKNDGQARFATQPVTFDELEEAKRQNESSSNDSIIKTEEDGNKGHNPRGEDDEDDPSKLSLAERVKLFNKKMVSDKLNIPITSRKSARFRTQPVTTEEVTTAKGMSSSSVSTLSKTASGILVSGILKNIAEKSSSKTNLNSSNTIVSSKLASNEDNNSVDGCYSENNDDDYSSEKSSNISNNNNNNKSVLRQQKTTNSPRINRKDKESDGVIHLKSVLKKESNDNNYQRTSDLHSILKSSTVKRESLSDESSDSVDEDDDDDDDDNDDYIRDISNKKSNKSLNLVNLLHQVEAEARIHSNEDNHNMHLKCLNPNEHVMNLKNFSDSTFNHKGRKKKDFSDTSEGDTSSSGGREIKRINNEAIARRRQATLAKQAAERVKGSSSLQSLSKSQSQSSISNENSETMVNGRGGETSVVGGLRRCLTQPMPSPPCDTVDEPLTIAQRLAALQKSGQSDWRKRVTKLGVEDELPSITINDAQEVLKQQVIGGNDSRSSLASPVPTSLNGVALAERLDQLQSATHGWKKRVEPSDAVQFSVAGRMALSPTAGTALMTSPVIERKKKAPRPARFRSKNRSSNKEVQSVPTSPEASDVNTSGNIRFERSISAPSGDEDSSLSPIENDGDDDAAIHGPRVTVPKELDENFSEFFSSANNFSKSDERLEIRDEDLEQVKTESRQMLVQAKRVKVQRRHEASGNPLKLLAARKDLRTEYVEVRSDFAQKEVKRINVEKLSKNSSLAVEALAGLASKEDFTSVSLRKANLQTPFGNKALLPYKDLMLLHIKGRRHVQTRLVKPHYTSVNQGDSYVLVAPGEVFHWMGKFSNIIERSRSSEVAQHILQKKDLGCSASNIVTLNGAITSNNHAKFWKLLGADEELAVTYTGTTAGHPDEDELYESALIGTNMMYYVEDIELVPIQKYWGRAPRIEILNPSKILVFDFGTELYVWMGRNATMDQRKSALQLAEELWSNGFDYTECDICPITAAQLHGSHSENDVIEEEKKGERPSWGLIAKVTQHMETILFREKFLDWPDFTRVIRVARRKSAGNSLRDGKKLKPVNAQDLLDWKPSPADLQLEGNHLGRGNMYFDEETRRHYEVTTQSVKVWHIEEFSSTELPEDSRGQFYSDDSYVVRWSYNLTVTGRELSGQPSKHATVGRDRCAYFIWQGSGATVNDQGAAALITVQLDSERGPQVRIPQGTEPPAFLSLFGGTAVIHRGKKGQARNPSDWRLYICKGEESDEAVLIEVACSNRSLRSRTSFLLVHVSTGCVYLWHGAKTLPHTRQVASDAVDKLTSGDMADFGLGHFDEIGFHEVHEGSEPKEFFEGLGGCKRHLYVSLLNCESLYSWTPRLFHLSSMLGQFISTPVIPPCSHPTLDCPFPYSQEDLYSAQQPVLFLLNSENILWLWQGWVPPDESYSSDPEDDDSSMNSITLNNSQSTGRNIVWWQAERRAAMTVALELWRLKHGEDSTPQVYLACAGLEPLEFTNLFPTWTDRDDIAEINITDGRKPGELLNVEEELARLTRSTYPTAQLLQRPLPEGVDPTRLEMYLSPQDFQELLGISKEQFSELPEWKQTNLKKAAGLF
ncbi:uncharacterized protein LOC142327040 [Lycorma delicatula]|uniref:uncharacterized protein LOC142327040 n=1 Tax=Lycorma delicatula TaxID=130591 RepID=UPI003F512BE5